MEVTSSSATAGPLYSQFHGDPDFRELLEEFVTTASERKATLEAAFATGAVTELERQAHQLKGAGGGYGYESLSEVAARLEDACRAGEPNRDEISRQLAVVVDHLSRISV